MWGAIRHKTLLVVLATGTLCGCGTYVPEIEEFWGSPDDVGIKVNAITSQVKCELSQSVSSLLAFDAAHPPRRLDFLRSWAAQVTLTLTILESTALNPGVTLNTPLNNASITYADNIISIAQSKAFGLGAGLSSAATRTDAITAIYRLGDFAPETMQRSCIPPTPNGTLFLQSDLKLRQWLFQALLPEYTGTVPEFPSKPNADVKNFISHEVKFQIVSNGGVTPTWTLVRVSANTGNSPFFNVNRDRTQDLLITLGPTEGPSARAAKGAVPILSTAAENSHLASQIGLAVATSVKAVR